MADQEYPAHADQLAGVPPPEAQLQLHGHQVEKMQLLDAYASGKLHHAWLIAGQKGIGKATFAFDVARELFMQSGGETPERVTQMVATGAHPNLKVIRRAFNHKTGKFAANTGVDVVREAMRFFQTTAATKGMRVCIVDSIDDLNTNAANALLKTLEEPPTNALFLLICNQLGKTLPTIRSRCRLLRLGVLGDTEVANIVTQIVGPDAQTQLPAVLEIARGRPRKAIEAIFASADPTLRDLGTWLLNPANSGDAKILQLGAAIAQSKDDALWPMALEMVENAIAWRIKHLAMTDRQNPALANAFSVWEKTGELLRDQAVFNLDKKQTIIMILDAIHNLDRIAPINVEPST